MQPHYMKRTTRQAASGAYSDDFAVASLVRKAPHT